MNNADPILTTANDPADPGGAPVAAAATAVRTGRRRPWLQSAEAYALPVLLLVVAIVFTFLPSTSDTFPSSANLQAIVGNQSVIGIIALAALIPLVCNQFDLSVGATLGLSSILSASVLSSGASIPVAIIVGIGAGGLVGVVNGLLITRAGVNAVIATLGTAIVIHGIVTWKTNGESIVDIPASMINFGSANTAGIPRTFFALLLVGLLIYYVLEHTPFGRYLYSLGSNPSAARLVGLNTNRLIFQSFIASGMLSGCAGVLQVARSGSASPQVGENFTLPALAAAFLSAAAIRPGRFNVGGVIIAIFFVAVLNSGLNLAGAESYVSDFVNGIALIAGVALSAAFGRNRSAA
ncbi:MAG: Ribose transport system permease protein RbsC [Solirubrobacterales bacterium]|nr:Ribose transport system permease protein RbsC [Solirubrobacterales bacterium]